MTIINTMSDTHTTENAWPPRTNKTWRGAVWLMNSIAVPGTVEGQRNVLRTCGLLEHEEEAWIIDG